MHILIEADLAGSKYHGMAYRFYQFGVEFLRRGHEVSIVAASFSHVRRNNPDVNNQITKESIDGITYYWIKTPKYRGNGVGRVLHMVVYNIKLYLYSISLSKRIKPDIVVSSGVTPFESYGCKRISKSSKAKMVFEVGDLWPLTPIELGGFSPKHPFIRMMQMAEDFAYKHCDAVVSLLPCASAYMMEHGMAKEKFNYIPNGIVLNEWDETKELPLEMIKIISDYRDRGSMLIGYAGSLSLANSLDYAFKAIGDLGASNVVFFVVGNGPEQNNLQAIIHNNGYSNIIMFPAISKEIIPAFLKEMDVLYVGFKKQSIYRFGISPNKIYDYMMSGKPIIQAIEAGNDIVKDANCGLSIPSEDIISLKEAVLCMLEMSETEKARLGRNGKDYVICHNSYDKLTEQYLNVFTRLLV